VASRGEDELGVAQQPPRQASLQPLERQLVESAVAVLEAEEEGLGRVLAYLGRGGGRGEGRVRVRVRVRGRGRGSRGRVAEEGGRLAGAG